MLTFMSRCGVPGGRKLPRACPPASLGGAARCESHFRNVEGCESGFRNAPHGATRSAPAQASERAVRDQARPSRVANEHRRSRRSGPAGVSLPAPAGESQ
ncbi:hypothetical protein DMC61_28775 [Amycolatopsis sp. WAC 04169]|nr:hypothetical protein DMC61_28775 [Amycolatopsis sp. WAC 04169]